MRKEHFSNSSSAFSLLSSLPQFFSQCRGWKWRSRVPVLLVCSPLVPARSLHPTAGGTSWDTGLLYSFYQVLQMGLTWSFPRERTHCVEQCSPWELTACSVTL